MTYRNESHSAPSSDLPDEGVPLGIFRDLPAIELDARELADMKRSVHEVIHARAVEAAIGSGSPAAPRRSSGARRGVRKWARRIPRSIRAASASATLRVAAAFGTVALATSLLVPAFAPQPLAVSQPPLAAYSPSRAELEAVEALPLVENLGSDTELIQIEDAEMSLVVAAIR